MDSLHVALFVVAGGAGGVAAYLWAQRSALAARVDAAGAALSGAESTAASSRAAAEAEIEGLRTQFQAASVRVAELQQQLSALSRQHTADVAAGEVLHADRVLNMEKREAALRTEIAALQKQMKETFESAAGRALKDAVEQVRVYSEQALAARTSESAAEMDKRKVAVEQLLRPIGEALKSTHEKLDAMEKVRAGAYSGLSEQVRAMGAEGASLRAETGKLVNALRQPHVRGRYGELTLRRVAELAGMHAYCDFTEQSTARDGDGNILRPDMVVKLPNGRELAVDAKTNIQAYLEALDRTTPEEQESCLERFARHVAEQAAALGRKGYWRQYDGAEFVVMFVPGDQFLDAALSRRGDLMEKAAEQGVLLATPSSLIGMLRAVAVGFHEQRVAAHAAEMHDLVTELHKRVATAMEHIEAVGTSLNRAVEKYNDFASSYQKRLLPQLKSIEEKGVKSGKELPEVEVVTGRAVLPSGPAV